MTPSPEAGELTPERLAELISEVAKAVDPVARRAADDIYERILTSVQDHLFENATYNIGSRLESCERERRIQWERAELAEQEASRWKAEAEKAVGQVRAIYKDGWEDGSLAGPTAYMNSRVNSEEAWLNSESFRALSSIRGDAP